MLIQRRLAKKKCINSLDLYKMMIILTPNTMIFIQPKF